MARGVYTRPRSSKLSDWELDEMLASVAGGRPVPSAAAAYGLSARSVYRQLAKARERREASSAAGL